MIDMQRQHRNIHPNHNQSYNDDFTEIFSLNDSLIIEKSTLQQAYAVPKIILLIKVEQKKVVPS